MKKRRNNAFWMTAVALAMVPAVALGASKKKKTEKKTTAVKEVVEKKPQLFLFCNDKKAGMKVAVEQEEGKWTQVGTLFQSDYSAWGSEKNMYAPYVTKVKGGYVAVFEVNQTAPCFGVAYSEDMVVWRPQDYPRMSSRGCLAPVAFEEADGTRLVCYQTPEGKVMSTVADKDFRHFSSDRIVPAGKYLAQRAKCDSALVDGKMAVGNLIEVDSQTVKRVTGHFAYWAQKQETWKESLNDDQRFSTLFNGKKAQVTVTIDGKQQKEISDKLIGIFFEDISYAADGGLYAEMVQNRDFEYCAADRREWHATTAWHSNRSIRTTTDHPIGKWNSHSVVVSNDTLRNEGWDGMAVKKGARYDFSCYVWMGKTKKKDCRVALMADDKTIGYADLRMKANAQEGWMKVETVITAAEDADKAVLALSFKGQEEVQIDMVSLFPQDTFNGRKNGLRKDLAQTIADLHPKFVRFPGGCMSHGQGLDNIYHWNHTVGPLYERKPDHNIWHYHQTRGLGFYEYFQFCEDIHAEPLPVLAAGVPCQNSAADKDGYGGQQGGISMEDMPAYIDEILALIEWANGDPASSQWAKMRADAGHPEPFGLKYIGVGNEDLISTTFEDRCKMICEAIKAKYPDIIVCGTVGPFHHPSSDYIEGWKFANDNRQLFDMVDEHYYESVGWFLNNQDYYDHYDRKGAKVYLGEYAARSRDGNIDCALAEAAYLCHIERNGDVVSMTSYAPLLCKNGHSNWNPDMIYFSNTAIRTTPSYETQRLFGTYSGNRWLNTTVDAGKDWSNRVAVSTVMDSKTGQRYLRITNILPVELEVDLKAVGFNIANYARYEGFRGKPGDRKATPVSGTIAKGEKLVMPAYSFVVVQL